jgi:2-dehydropantoate 2-reductase
MKVLIVGGGALGCFLASRLIPFAKISLTCRSNYQSILRNGITLISNGIKSRSIPFQVYPNTDAAQGHAFDHIIVTTKVLPTIDLVQVLSPVLSGNPMVHLIQNGVGIEDKFHQAYPNIPLSSTVAFIGVWQQSLGTIVQNGHVSFTIGNHEQSRNNEQKFIEFLDLLKSSSLNVSGPVADIQLARWHKLLWNCSFNPIAILAGRKNCGELLADPGMESLIRQVMNEVQGASLSIFGKPFPKENMTIEDLITMTKRDLPTYKPSMLLDWEANREIEIEAILANPISIAAKHGVEMPRLNTIYQLLKIQKI